MAIHCAAPGVEDAAKLAGALLGFICRGRKCPQALVADLAERHGLDGVPVAPVSDENRALAVGGIIPIP